MLSLLLSVLGDVEKLVGEGLRQTLHELVVEVFEFFIQVFGEHFSLFLGCFVLIEAHVEGSFETVLELVILFGRRVEGLTGYQGFPGPYPFLIIITLASLHLPRRWFASALVHVSHVILQLYVFLLELGIASLELFDF